MNERPARVYAFMQAMHWLARWEPAVIQCAPSPAPGAGSRRTRERRCGEL